MQLFCWYIVDPDAPGLHVLEGRRDGEGWSGSELTGVVDGDANRTDSNSETVTLTDIRRRH